MCCQRNPFYSTMLLYTYISRFSVPPHYIKSGRVAATNAVPQPFLIAVSTSLTNGPRLLSRAKVGTHSAFRERSHTTAHTPKEGGVSDGAAITTLDTYCTFTNIPGPGIRTAYFAAFGSWPGVRSRRTQKAFGTAMRMMCVAVPRRRGPAGLRDLFRFCRNRDLYIRRSWFSACARHGWYHYPRCAPRAAETLDGRLSKRFIFRFLRPGSLH